jgi:hypothetical protein
MHFVRTVSIWHPPLDRNRKSNLIPIPNEFPPVDYALSIPPMAP